MSLLFATPWALWGLLEVPLLAAIYLLRQRYRPHLVSSLLLWQHQKPSHQGGQWVDRLILPLLFFIELLILLLLILAAAGPMLGRHQQRRAFVVVLDNSASMLAEYDGRNARDRAIEGLQRLLEDTDSPEARCILAGKTPERLAVLLQGPDDVAELLRSWSCQAPTAEMDKALSLATELAGETARMLVLTDHPPADPEWLDSGRLQWWAFGSPVPNHAIINALRRRDTAGQDRCLISLANLSDEPAELTVRVEIRADEATPSTELLTRRLTIPAGENRHERFTVPAAAGVLRVSLDQDAQSLDNSALLPPRPEKPLRVMVAVRNEALKTALTDALTAAGVDQLTAVSPHIGFTDMPAATIPNAWSVRFHDRGESRALIGPFIQDRAHPFCRGLSWQGVIWSTNDTLPRKGQPLLTAGNTQLVTTTESADRQREINLYIDWDHSSLSQSPNWPILLWNSLEWRRAMLPGVTQSAIPLGGQLTLALPPEQTTLTITHPDGSREERPVQPPSVFFEPASPGLYQLAIGSRSHLVAANLLSRREADLRQAGRGRWGRWDELGEYEWQYVPLSRYLLLAVLAALMGHQYLVARKENVG